MPENDWEYSEEGYQEYNDDSVPDIEEEYRGDSQAPFDPAEIRMSRRTISLDSLIKRLKHNELNLSPDFQREKSIWPRGAQSRLIESLLIRVPIPAFYFDATNEDKWLVIDGVQRLTALARFVMDEYTLSEPHLDLSKLVLNDLEFLTDLNGKKFEDLERADQRSIEETDFTIYTITKGTPENVKYNIFKRINTGGVALSDQEIRNAFHAGKATALLDQLAKSPEFLKATHGMIDRKRRGDQECILRFIAFTLLLAPEYEVYEKPDFDQLLEEYRRLGFDQFLRNTMNRINRMSNDKREKLERQFTASMEAAYEIFGACAFCKANKGRYRGAGVNNALFEVWSVNLGILSDGGRLRLIENKEYVTNKFLNLLNDREFSSAILSKARDASKVKVRFEKVDAFINEMLQVRGSWEDIENDYSIGEIVSGNVIIIDDDNAILEIKKGVLGLIPSSEFSWTKRHPRPRDFFKLEETVKGVVLEIDHEKQCVLLSHKQIKPDPWPDAPTKYSVGTVVQGKIVRTTNFGAFVELKDSIEGLIHISELASGFTQRVQDVVSIGQELDLKVISLDMDKRQIGLSLKDVLDEQPPWKEELKKINR